MEEWTGVIRLFSLFSLTRPDLAARTLRKELCQKEQPRERQCSDENRWNSNMAINNITSVASAYPQRQGAVINSVAHIQEYKVHYGVQSATFVRTVFPGQASGTYRLNGRIPTWQGAQITAKPGTLGSQSAGSPPRPYPPSNASAYYSPPQTRIVPNYSCTTCR